MVEEKYHNYELHYQYTVESIRKVDRNFLELVNGYLTMQPDIIINKNSRKPVLVIDTKYIDIFNKNKLENYAYYQMISYLTGLSTRLDKEDSLSAILLSHGTLGHSYKIPSIVKTMYVFTEGINILSEESELKEQLKALLDKSLVS